MGLHPPSSFVVVEGDGFVVSSLTGGSVVVSSVSAPVSVSITILSTQPADAQG
ncbi:MAG: hypothetical protein IJ303_02490 [Clostridia bacterium]|nr:hypothetical protein [Clostridia bacterium]